MKIENLKQLIIGNLTATLPIIQGGMGVGISLSGMAAAVANQGGVGVIAAAGIGMLGGTGAESNSIALGNEIRKARKLTNGILGVNIMVALSDFAELVKTSIDEGVDIIFSGAGLPLDLPGFLNKTSETKLVPIVSSAKAAKIMIRKWFDKFSYIPDAIVVEGPKAGGHLGFKAEQLDDPAFSLETIVSEVVECVKEFEGKLNRSIPVIAGGGIYTGEDIYNVMKLGASGVQMATRFVTTDECDASLEFKKTYLNAKKEDIGIIKSPVGMPGRAITNEFLNDVEQGKKKPFKCPFHCIVSCTVERSPYCIALALLNAQKGILKNGFAFAGINAYRATEILPIKKVMDAIKSEHLLALNTDMSLV